MEKYLLLFGTFVSSNDKNNWAEYIYIYIYENIFCNITFIFR